MATTPGRRSSPVSPRSSTRSPASRSRTSSWTSPSPTTWTSTRCPWSRSWSRPRSSFGVKIPDEDVKNLKTVGDAADYILKRQA